MYDLSKFKAVKKSTGGDNRKDPRGTALVITKDKMALTAEAVKLLGNPEYAWFGIDEGNRLVLVRPTSEKDAEGAKLCRKDKKARASWINHTAFREVLLKAIRKYDPAVVDIILTGKPIEEVRHGLVFDYSMNIKTEPRRRKIGNEKQ